MSDIYKVDTKETNSTELLHVPEGPELIGTSNIQSLRNVVNNIQLDKTNIETYMDDFKKNFYKIKFDNVLLEDISELYNIKEDTKNGKDLRNNSFGLNQDNNSKEDKQIQPVPIGMRGLSSSINQSSNIFTTTDLVKSSTIRNSGEKTLPTSLPSPEAPVEIPCVGFSYSPNIALIYPTFTSGWTITTGNKVIPMNLNLTIPAFKVYSSDVGIDFLDQIPVIDSGCNTLYGGDLIFCGFPCAGTVQMCKKCVSFKFFGKKYTKCISYPCGVKLKVTDQIYLKPANYIPSQLINFDGIGVKFNGKIENKFDITFELDTNIPVQFIINVIQQVVPSKHNDVKNFTDKKLLIGKLKDIFTFQNILQIMIFAYSIFAKGDITPYVDFLITSVKTRFNLNIQYFSVNYGSNKFELSNFTFDKEFEALENGKYISFSLNPQTLELEAKFIFFSGTLTELLIKIASQRGQTYINTIIKPAGLRGGMFLIIILVVYETVLKNNDEIENLTQQGLNKTKEQKAYIANLVSKNKILNATLGNIWAYYNVLKNINIGQTSSIVSNIIEKCDPAVELSVGVCSAPAVPAVLVGCGSIAFPEIDILKVLKLAIIGIINVASGTLKVCDKIGDGIISKIPDDEIKNTLREINNDIDSANNILKNLLLIAVQNVFAVLDTAGLGIVASPSIDWCVGL